MSTQIQWRRGTTAQHNVFTGALGEVTVDTDKDTLVVHDNSTVGGFPLARESALNTHIDRTDNPHGVTKTQVGLGNAENTADADKVVLSAGKLTTTRTINGVNFDGTTAITVTANTTHSEIIKFDTGTTEGTDLYTFNGSSDKTIDIKAGTNVTLTKSTGSITINANDTSIAVTEITGMVAGASTFLTTPTSANLAGMLTDETGTGANVFANSPTLVAPALGVATGTSFNSITGLSSTIPIMDGTATAGTGVTVARADHVHPKDITKVVANANITAGTYKSVTVDVKGLVTGGTNPTTIGGYGITDAYTKTELDAVNVLRADKFLAAQNIAAMVYTAGDLTKIQYNNATNVNYEVLNYTSGNLSSINHYTASVLRGTTTLSYLGGNLVSAIFA